jgi:Domain of unknown function (DUF4410)
MKRRRISVLLLTVIALAAAPALHARGKKPAPTEPGTYKEWGPDIDEIQILKSFKIANYDRVVVLPFDTSATPLPDQNDKSYGTIKSVLAGYSGTLVEALRPELKAPAKVETADNAPKTAKTLIIRGKVEEMSPGSRAKRYLAGYGAGAGGSKATGEIVDAKTGEVLAKFTQEHRSGGTFKFGGGSDTDVMHDSIHATGQDIAHILDAF